MKLIEQCEDLLRKILIAERRSSHSSSGRVCQICGNPVANPSLFHILNKKDFPRLRLDARNILLAGWWCCHYKFHHDPYFARDVVWPRIAELLGPDWEAQLKVLNSTKPKLDMLELSKIRLDFQSRLSGRGKGAL